MDRPTNDSWIAACCLVDRLPLATFNGKDYADFAEYDVAPVRRLVASPLRPAALERRRLMLVVSSRSDPHTRWQTAARQPIAPTSTAPAPRPPPAIVTDRSSDVSGSRGRSPYGASMDPLDLPAIVDVCRSLKRGWDLRGVEQQAWGADQDDLLTPVDPLASVTLRLGETSGVAEIWPTGYVRLMRGDSRVDHVQVSGPFELRDQLVRLTNWLTDPTP
ncbi:hypothetical protein [Salinispora cortesiana]|uniref:hypothetical protein n=1 Tax=Salinispora cortesiana TaxID=1305843 RepID=UPI0003F6AD37|nr:hypothetical protein [Salinispora cortesiana]